MPVPQFARRGELIVLAELQRIFEARVIVREHRQPAEGQPGRRSQSVPPPRRRRPRRAPDEHPPGNQQHRRAKEVGRPRGHRQPQAQTRQTKGHQRTPPMHRRIDRHEREHDKGKARSDRQLPHHRTPSQRQQVRAHPKHDHAERTRPNRALRKVAPAQCQPQSARRQETHDAKHQHRRTRRQFAAGDHRVRQHQDHGRHRPEIEVEMPAIVRGIGQPIRAIARRIVRIRQRNQLRGRSPIQVQMAFAEAAHQLNAQVVAAARAQSASRHDGPSIEPYHQHNRSERESQIEAPAPTESLALFAG